MTEAALIMFCWLALGVTTLVFVVGAAVGAAYHPGEGATYFVVAASPLAVIGGLLGLFPRVKGVVWVFVLLAMALAGVALVGTFAFRLFADGGDALLWTPPLLLGLGLVALVLGFGRSPVRQEDA